MSYSTIASIPTEKRMILGLGRSDTIFRSKVCNILQLDLKNPQDQASYNAIVNEVCYQVVDAIVKDFRQFLDILNRLPNYQTLPSIPEDPIAKKYFSDAVKEFGLHIGFGFKPYWHINENHDVLFSIYQEGMIGVLLFPKAVDIHDIT